MKGRTIEDIYPLSPLQEGMIFHGQLAPGAGLYVEQTCYRLTGDLRLEALQSAWEHVALRHPALRVSMTRAGGGRALQVVHADAAPRLVEVDWRDSGEAALPARFEAFLQEDRAREFDLLRAPLMRLTLLRVGEREWRLVWSFHHALLDGWSASLVISEVAAAYAAQVRGQAIDLPHAPPFREFVSWLNRQDPAASREFWRRTLAGLRSVPRLPADVPSIAGESRLNGKDGIVGHRETTLSPPVGEALAAFCRRHRLTPGTVASGAAAVVLARSCGSEEAVLGMTVSGRPAELPGVDRTVGPFINTLPLRAAIPPGARTLDWFQRLQAQQAEARQHGEVSLAEMRGWSDLPPGESLFDTLLAVETYPDLSPPDELTEDVGLEIEVERTLERTNYPLVLMVDPTPPMRVKAAWDPGIYRPETIDGLLDRIALVLESLAQGPPERLADLPAMRETERRRILVEWNQTGATYPADRSIGALFEEHARRNPSAVALMQGEQKLTYGELDRRADLCAGMLRGLGVGPETPVGVCAERSMDTIASILGILKAGGVWVPLDPAYPAERLAVMIEDAGVRTILVAPELARLLEGTAARIVPMDSATDLGTSSGAVPDHRKAAPPVPGGDRLACIFFTSGSTGRPKGVAVTHRGVARLVRAPGPTTAATSASPASYVRFGPGETFLQYAPLSFDASTFEIWGALLNGGRLVIAPPGPLSLEDLGQLVEETGVTTLWLTAPLFQRMAEGHLPALRGVRQLLAGGDVLHPASVARALDALPETRLVNGYGPTEGTTFTCCHAVGRDSLVGRSIPIGRPIANTRVHILDRDFRPVPIGVPGELCIGGDGLARGYVGDPALTAERFVPDPFAGAGGPGEGSGAGGRLYRTGDLARWLPEGEVEFLGRRDHQVKIRGHRVEAGEIESALVEHPAVREAIVSAREDGAGDRRLFAWIVPRRSPDRPESPLDLAGLRGWLETKLPSHMIPSRLIEIDELPITPSGKLDRSRLPVPEAGRPGRGPVPSPMTPVEELVAGIWGGLLEVESLAREDDFFQLGGHSLVAMQVISRLHETMGLDIPLRAIFDAPTLGAFSARVEDTLRTRGRGSIPEGEAANPASAATESGVPHAQPSPPPLRPPPLRSMLRDAPLPLSFAQQRLWFLDQLEPASSFYNVPAALRLRGRLDAAALERSLGEIVRRHESLRTSFPVVDGRPVQAIADPALFRLDVKDLPHAMPEAVRRAPVAPEAAGEALPPDAAAIAREQAVLPFDLARGPLLRARLLRLGDDDHLLLLTMHHIVSDGWSVGVLLRELRELYTAFSRGLPSTLPELAIQYGDYARWQRGWLSGNILERQVDFWKRYLEGAPAALDLPADRPRPRVQTFNGSQVEFDLGTELSSRLGHLARAGDATEFMVLLAAFQALLHRHAGQDVVVGTPVANRRFADVEGLIGFFVNMLPIRGRFGNDPRFSDLLDRVRGDVLDAWAHQDIPFEQLVESLAPARDVSRSPLFQAMFVMDAAPPELPALEGLEMTAIPQENLTAKYDVSLSMTGSSRQGLSGVFEYNTDLFDRPTIEALVERFRSLLEAVAEDAAQRVSELPLLAPGEERRLRIEWNDTAVVEPDAGRCLHELVARQAAEQPGAIALVAEGATLTFGDLDRQANALAWQLRDLGVGPDVPVAICLPRGVEMVIAALAALKAGGAYLPLDPEHPAARLALQIEDAAAPVLVSRSELASRLPEEGRRLWLDGPIEPRRPEEASTPPPVRTRPSHIAYVIYTSGSTGKPKGVMIPHSGIVNRLLWVQREYGLMPDDRVLQKTPFTFDVSVWELFWPLIAGARLVLARPDGHRDPRYLVRAIRENGITTLHFVPSMMAAFLREEDLPCPGPLRRVFSSGEALTVELQERFFERVGAPLHNQYGPTEVSVDATFWACERNGGRASVPIGRPVANTRAYVLDARLRLVPPGVAGELCLAGAGLARGYVGNPAATAERFVPDPFAPADQPGRLYRTGDLARHAPDGALEFLGRRDHQVKIRGVRIEPGEIEAALLEHPAIDEAAVVRARGGGEERLVACVAADAALDIAEVRAFLRARLPEVMVPAAIVRLERLPKTSSGKLDRSALPLDSVNGESLARSFVPPRSPVERVLARTWGEILGVERVGVLDNLFDLGGHSLLATQILHRVQDLFHVELPLRDLFEEPTIEAQARAVVAAEASAGRSEKIARIIERVEGMSATDVEESLRGLTETEGAA